MNRDNKGRFVKGNTPWHKNKKGVYSEKTLKLMSLAKKGKIPWYGIKEENSPNWKGVYAKYHAKHIWVRKHKGKPKICIACRKNYTEVKKIEWANIDHQYRRILKDYISLCTSCHRKYDKKLINKTEGY